MREKLAASAGHSFRPMKRRRESRGVPDIHAAFPTDLADVIVYEVLPRLEWTELVRLGRTCKRLTGVLYHFATQIPITCLSRCSVDQFRAFKNLSVLDLRNVNKAGGGRITLPPWVYTMGFPSPYDGTVAERLHRRHIPDDAGALAACASTLTVLAIRRAPLFVYDCVLQKLTRLVCLDGFSVNDTGLCTATSLTTLAIHGVLRVSNAGLCGLVNLTSLDIRVTGCCMDETFPPLPRLTTLAVTDVCHNFTGYRERFDQAVFLRVATRLTRLKFVSYRESGATTWLAQLTNLEALAMRSRGPPTYNRRGIDDALLQLTRLSYLELDMRQLADHNRVFYYLRKNLTSLKLVGMTLSPQALWHLGHLTQLRLKQCMPVEFARGVQPASFDIFLHGNPTLGQSLRALELHKCRYFNNSSIVSRLASLTSLTAIDCVDGVTEDIAGSLPHLTTLTIKNNY